MDTSETLPPVFASEKTLKLDGERLAFFQSATGIQDAEQLREHIIAVQREGIAVGRVFSRGMPSSDLQIIQIKPYPCIANFYFTK